MILVTHSVIAAAVVKQLGVSNPAAAFTIGVATHYLSDAIPHWSYDLTSIEDSENVEKRHWNKSKFWFDALKFSFDGLSGLAIVYWAAPAPTFQDTLPFLLAAVGGCFPDALQAIYITIKFPFLRPHQKFHDWMHAKIRLEPYPLIGIPFQLLIFFLALVFLR